MTTDDVLRTREKALETAALAIEDTIAKPGRRPSPYTIAARDSFRQAAAAVAQARAVTGEPRLKLLRVAYAFADAGQALEELGEVMR